MPTTVLDRFLRYVRIDTRSDEQSRTVPSTPGPAHAPLSPGRRAAGARDRRCGDGRARLRDGHGPGDGRPSGGTDHWLSRSRRHVAGDAGRERRADRPRALRRPRPGAARRSHRRAPRGRSSRARRLPERRHRHRVGADLARCRRQGRGGGDHGGGRISRCASRRSRTVAIRIGFTPDEEVGRGADHFDVAAFGAVCAYTLDGGGPGELEYESFSADAITVTFKGFNTHPGYAKGQMVNAIKIAADFIASLPKDGCSPETTDGYEGYVASVSDGGGRRSHERPGAAARLRDQRAGRQGGACRAPGRVRRSRTNRAPPSSSSSSSRIATCARCSTVCRT